MLPNFLIVGAPRAGTTSLYHYCMEHPSIYMSPVKEANYFSNSNSKYTLDEYERLFNGVMGEQAIGEASPSYLRMAETPQRIVRTVPNCKIIMILRHPIARIWSDYQYSQDYGFNVGAFNEFITSRDTGDAGIWYSKAALIEKGMYASQVDRYIKIFGRERVLVCLYDDLEHCPSTLMGKVFGFLGVSEDFLPNVMIRHNRHWGGSPPLLITLARKLNSNRNARTFMRGALDTMLTRVGARAGETRNRVKARLSPKSQERLIALYSEDVSTLQQLIDRDLSEWMRPMV